MIQGMLMEVGVKTNIETVDNATMHERRPNFDYDLTFFATYGAPYDPHRSAWSVLRNRVGYRPGWQDLCPSRSMHWWRPRWKPEAMPAKAPMQAVYDWLRDNTAACPLVVTRRLWP